MKKEIIASYKHPNYTLDITLFCLFFIVVSILLITFITARIIVAIAVCSIFLLIGISFFVFRIVYINKCRKKDNTLVYYVKNIFYFPMLNLQINKAKISRVVYEMKKYVFIPINKTFVPMENNIGKLHLTYFDKNEEYYIVLKHVISPDIVERRIKEICDL